ncbi:MAG: type II toxin-antitoxin system PemK/MazF family toxin [Defluviitaleaceae bacterium]|nr:type II toxin-antitoxin system PemK/MazF family toxin [Defluviitaleaceae bacterium]
MSKIETANKFVNGSIWHWDNQRNQTEGVQSGQRPILIISNNTFNRFSASVNCLSITTNLKDSPVHVPIMLSRQSHIQCEQVHTVSKSELTEYLGTAPHITMSYVNEKLKLQLSMNDDRHTELLLQIKDDMDALNKKLAQKPNKEDIITIKNMLDSMHLPSSDTETSHEANEIKAALDLLLEETSKGYGIRELQDRFMIMLDRLHGCILEIVGGIEKLKYIRATTPVSEIEDIEPQTETGEEIKTKGRAGNKDEIKFGINIEDISSEPIHLITRDSIIRGGAKGKVGKIEKLDEEDTKSPAEKKTRSRNTKNLKNESSEIVGITEVLEIAPAEIAESGKKQKQIHREYTEDDRAFIADENVSIKQIMERFGYKNKQAAYSARTYIRRTLAAKAAR